VPQGTVEPSGTGYIPWGCAGFDPCSKCCDYATRRLTEAQLGYDRAAHQLYKSASHLRWALDNRAMARETTTLSIEVEQ
jgi:hypothetical protein